TTAHCLAPPSTAHFLQRRADEFGRGGGFVELLGGGGDGASGARLIDAEIDQRRDCFGARAIRGRRWGAAAVCADADEAFRALLGGEFGGEARGELGAD